MKKSDGLLGLNDKQVLAKRKTHGLNELPSIKRAGPSRVLLRQFSNLLVLILIAAAAIAFALEEYIDAATISLVVVLNAVLGFVQEWKAETALASLRKLLSPQAMVIRNGQEQMIPTRDVVPGDLIVLTPGANVPADANLITAADLSVDESILTGESVSVSKDIQGMAG
jgi:Ca2+-transporting ATPase